MNFDATEQNPPVWDAVLGGTGLALVWAIVARIWMRLISTKPEFSIPGTVGILLIASIFGAGTGLAYAARRRGWRRWGHYLPRTLVVAFFIPFGVAEGLILMLTVLAVTLSVTQPAVVGLWVLAAMAILLAVGTDIGVPPIAADIALGCAVVLTTWKLIVRPWLDGHRIQLLDTWLERIMRIPLILLAVAGIAFTAREVMTSKPGLLGALYVLFYVLLLYPLFLALRIGLEPRVSSGSHQTSGAFW